MPRTVLPTPQEKMPSAQHSDRSVEAFDARARLAARQAQKAVTAKTLAMAHTALESLRKGEQPALCVVRILPRIGGVYYALAVDLASAVAKKAQSIALCDETGSPLKSINHPRSNLPLSLVLDSQIEPVVLIQDAVPSSEGSPANVHLMTGEISEVGTGEIWTEGDAEGTGYRL